MQSFIGAHVLPPLSAVTFVSNADVADAPAEAGTDSDVETLSSTDPSVRPAAHSDAHAGGRIAHPRHCSRQFFHRCHPSIADVIQVRTATGHVIDMDAADWPTVEPYYVCIHQGRACVKRDDRRTGLAQLFMGWSTKGTVTYLDGNPCNVRKSNLHLQLPVSGMAGVRHDAPRHRWELKLWQKSKWVKRYFSYAKGDADSCEEAKRAAVSCEEENNATITNKKRMLPKHGE